MRRFVASLSAAAVLSGCSASEPTTPSLQAARESLAGTYVLAELGTLKGAPFQVIDRWCGANQDIHWQSWYTGDTIVLNADGSATKSWASLTIHGADTSATYAASRTGTTWQVADAPDNYWFYGGSKMVTVSAVLGPSDAQRTTVPMMYRLNADGSLSYPSTLGESCVGSPNANVRAAYSVYRKI
jgi:hypothetical protein